MTSTDTVRDADHRAAPRVLRLRRPRRSSRASTCHPRRARSSPSSGRTARASPPWSVGCSASTTTSAARSSCSAAARHRSTTAPGSATSPSGTPCPASVRATVAEIVAVGRLPHHRWWRPVVRSTQDAAIIDRRPRRSSAWPTGAHADVATLSGGQQRRVLIARALASEPDVLLMDEPTAGVDTANQQVLAAVLARLADRGTTMVIVTHELGAARRHRHPDRRACTAAASPSTGRATSSPLAQASPRSSVDHHHEDDEPRAADRRCTASPSAGPLDPRGGARLMSELLSLDFMRQALIAAVLVGVAAPLVGVFLVQRRLSLIGDGMGHVALAGVAVGVLTGQAPVLTALVAAVAAAVAIELIRGRGRTSGDVALAVMFYGGIAAGVVLIIAKSPAQQPRQPHGIPLRRDHDREPARPLGLRRPRPGRAGHHLAAAPVAVRGRQRRGVRPGQRACRSPASTSRSPS